MKRHITYLGAILISLSSFAQNPESYQVEIDLTATTDDKVPVTIQVPAIADDVIEYHMAKIVPGTYSISDFGRFVSEFKAYDAEGTELSVENVSTNRWKISDATKLTTISYLVDDTRDETETYGADSKNVVFEPGGTEITKDELYVMNTFGLIGYIDGRKFTPYNVTIKHPETLYGSSALLKKAISTTEDVFSAEDFNFLADGPIMYCAPDTVTKKIANAEVLVSVYSQNSVMTAAEIMDNIDELMEAQSQYLGGELPVDRYAYLVTLFDGPTLSGGYGALEHSYSSLYYLPERAGDRISQIIKDVAAHEFFHIVTPLNIHSKQIGEFDYINPQMSKHLWLYEGVTEYSAIHVQGKYGFFTTEEFLTELGEKMSNTERFGPDISFTEMSENILDEEFEPLYGNVYQKGALIGMCLDISLLKYSNGEKDLQWLMRELAKKYGKNTSFEDDKLFEVITELTYPEIGEFLDTYVAGDEPLPFKEILGWVGVNYSEPHATQVISFGNVSLSVNEDGQIVIADISEMNSFGKDLGLQTGDILININGEDINMTNTAETIANFKEEGEAGDKVYYTVLREKKGKLKKKKLKAKAISVEVMTGYNLELDENMTEEQRTLLNAWIKVD